MKEIEETWPVYWLIDEGVITWTEANTLMNIFDVDRMVHAHLATVAAQRRAEEAAARRSRR